MDTRLKKSIDNFALAAAIGARLRHVREDLDLSQERVAESLEVSRENYANFELGRTPIKVALALRFCRMWIVSEKWLATGEGSSRAFMNLDQDQVSTQIRWDTPFSEAYELHLAERYETLTASSDAGVKVPLGFEETSDARPLLQLYLRMWGAWVYGDEGVRQLVDALIEAGNAYCQNHPHLAGTQESMLQMLLDCDLPLCSKRAFAKLPREDSKGKTEQVKKASLRQSQSKSKRKGGPSGRN